MLRAASGPLRRLSKAKSYDIVLRSSLMPHALSATLPPLRAVSTLNTAERRARNDDKRAQVARDFRSDTVTVPTKEMLALMQEASLGDDVFGEDPDTIELERTVAALAGKEAGLFCASGTMTNQLAIRTHLVQPPHSVVTDSRAHVHCSEAGGIAYHGQAQPHTVFARNGHHMSVEEVLDECVVEEDVHVAMTRLVCVENTLSGMIFPQDELVRLRRAVDDFSIPLHCDGARLWDVSAKTGLPLAELCEPFHSVSLCLSKGIGAPVGSVLVGPTAFIAKARWFRKSFGGGMRQSGPLALAASHALSTVFPRLTAVHALATRLAHGLVERGVALDLPVETGMVWIDTEPAGFSVSELQSRAWEKKGVRIGAPRGRLVLHYQIEEQAVEDLLEVVGELAEERRDEAKRWEERVGRQRIDEVRRRSRLYAEGKWEGRIEGPKRRMPAYVRGG